MSPLTSNFVLARIFFLFKLKFRTTPALFVVVLFLVLLSLHLQECDGEKGINLCFKNEQQGKQEWARFGDNFTILIIMYTASTKIMFFIRRNLKRLCKKSMH